MPTSLTPAVLAVNVGSSSLKCAIFTFAAEPDALAREALDGAAATSVGRLIDWVDRQSGISLKAIGHRLVHGGALYRAPQRITPAVLDALTQLIPFAPNHLPDEIAVVDTLARHEPAVPQVACFDTAFHAGMPEVARRLPIPAEYDAAGVRRYGFHGLSFSYLVEELEHLAGPDAATGRVILAHLGSGSSLAAVHERHSVDTTMSFTPIGGVVMSTRSGDLDPGVVTYLARSARLAPDQVEDLLSHHAGLLGISGASGDMRALLANESSHPACRLAVAAYVYAVRKAVGALAAALGGLDTLVFSGGIGEHAPLVRARICEGLQFLGLELVPNLNLANAPVISAPGARVAVRVIATDEELMIARAAYRVLGP